MPEDDAVPVQPLPCPFCGSLMISTSEDSDNAFMRCEECEAVGPGAVLGVGKHFDIARSLWNLRSSRWVPASEGPPPVTDTRFAVLLIRAEERNFTTHERTTVHFLRPYYPGAKRPIPDDAYWLLLPPLPEKS